jgi:hypothetical protein
MDENRLSNATLEPAGPDSSDTSGAIAMDYAKSFHLRFAGNSTVRKKRRPKLRQRREGADNHTSSEEEYDFDGDDAELQRDDEVNVLDSQEMRMKLSQREYIKLVGKDSGFA